MYVIKIVGRSQWPRYVVVDDQRQFWTGEVWIPTFRGAALYANPQLAEEECQRLFLQSNGLFPPEEPEP